MIMEENPKGIFNPRNFFSEHHDKYWVGVKFTDHVLDGVNPFNPDKIEECPKPITITLVNQKAKEFLIKIKSKEEIFLSAIGLLSIEEKKGKVILGYVLSDQDGVVRVASATFKKGLWWLWCEEKIKVKF